MTRMTTAAEQRRERFENVLTSLSVARLYLQKQAVLRVEQAVRRDESLRPLLEPAIGYMEHALSEMVRTGLFLGEIWQESEQKDWE
jgi:hypothetical protein